MNGQQENPPKMEANTPVMIVLPLIGWTNVLQFLGKIPWEQVNGLIVTINQQLQNAGQRQQQNAGPVPQPKAMIERD